MKSTGVALFAGILALLTTAGSAIAAKPAIVSVEKIWDAGKHNAFTDLIRFDKKFYCVFRESEGHVGGDGKIRVIVSADGNDWKSAALLAEKGVDLRDPKLSVTPDGRVMLTMGGSVYRGTKTLISRRPRVAFSKDGVQWTKPKPVLEKGDWLWRVTWHNGTAYGVSYRTSSGKSSSKWLVELFKSDDGLKWESVTKLKIPNRPNETTLRFLPDGEMLALVRREAGSRKAWIGAAEPPYKSWTWRETKHRVGGPNFIRLPDGSLWAGGRSYPGGAKTVLATMTKASYTPVLTLPSGGDTSYPGFVWHDGLLWMSYYASHEGKTSIYLAKIRVK